MPYLPPLHVPVHATRSTTLLERHRPTRTDTEQAHHRYTGRWRAYARHYLLRRPLCAVCHSYGDTTPATQVDHILPCSSERDPLFWNPENHQPLCRPCHGRKTRIEAR